MFELGDLEYIVRRGEGSAKVLSRSDLEQNWVQVADGTKGVTAYLTERLGMSHSEFAATYMCRQRDIARFAAMKPMERQVMVRRLMGSDRLDAAVQAARKEARDTSFRLEEREGLLGDGDALTEALSGAEAYQEEAALAAGEVRENQKAATLAFSEAEAVALGLGKLKYRYLEAKGARDRTRMQIVNRKQWLTASIERRDEAKRQVQELSALDEDLVGYDAATGLLAEMDEAAETVNRRSHAFCHGLRRRSQLEPDRAR